MLTPTLRIYAKHSYAIEGRLVDNLSSYKSPSRARLLKGSPIKPNSLMQFLLSLLFSSNISPHLRLWKRINIERKMCD